jgi:molecular chaperone GrpE
VRAVAGSNEKSSIQTDIGQDVIDAAVRSVERHMDEDDEVTVIEVEASGPPSEDGTGAPAAQDTPPTGAATPEEVAALRQEVESLKAQLEFSQAKGRETMERLRETHERTKDAQERTVRAAADLENYRKRAQKEKEEVQRFGSEKLLKDLLPVMDNLDRALEAAAKSPDIDSFQKGVAMTRKSFEDARLVRPALVVVARAPAPAEAATVTEPAGAEQASTSGTEGAPVPPQSENSSGGSQ